MNQHYRLSALTPLATGCARQCFTHQDQPDLCLKLPLHGLGLRHCLAEETWYRRLYAENGPEQDLPLARYLGRVTIEGQTAFAFRLIRDTSGQVSRTLFDALTPQSLAGATDSWVEAHRRFRADMLAGAIVASDLTGMNICVQCLPDEQRRFVLVDGLGDYRRERLTNLHPWTRRSRVRRRLDRWLCSDIQALADALANSRCWQLVSHPAQQPIDNALTRCHPRRAA